MIRRLFPLALLVVLAACSDDPDPIVVGSDDSDRIQALSRRLQELEAEMRANVVTDREAEALRKRVADLEREQRTFREALAAARTAAAASGSVEPGSGETTPRYVAPVESSGSAGYDPPTVSGSDSAFTEEQVTSFRRLQEEVDRRKEVEQRTERVKRQLDRLGVTLEPPVQQAVIDRTLAHQEKVQQLVRGGFGRTDDERAEVTRKLDDLRAAYERDLRAVVPPEHGDKVVEALGRANPGFVRRVDAGMRR